MRMIRSCLAAALSSSVALLSPGIGVHAVLAQSMAAGVQIPGATNGALGVAGASGFSIHGRMQGPSSSISLGLGSLAVPSGVSAPRLQAVPGSASAAAPSLGAARAVASVSLPASVGAMVQGSPARAPASRPEAASLEEGGIAEWNAARTQPASSERLGALKTLGREMPDFGRMGTVGAKNGAESYFIARIGGRAGGGNAAARSRQMPSDEPSTRTGPDDTDDLDEIGNPRRRQDDGPDSVSDGSEGRGGDDNGVLFGTMRRGSSGLLSARSPAARSLGEEDAEGGLTAPSQADLPASVDLIVMLQGAARPLATDVHLSLVGRGRSSQGLLKAYQAAQQVMLSELAASGLGQDVLDAFGASPVATYRRINAATLRVAASRAADFKAALEAKGYQVYDNAKREIVAPIRPDETRPDAPRPSARGAVTLPETLKISTADKVHDIARARWGAPGAELGFIARLTLGLLRRLGLLNIPQPAVGVIDTGADTSHKLLRGVKEVKNVTRGENVDDNGHGTWVTSLVLYFAPWLKNVTHYKTFEGGGASLDDILKALTLSGNDGNIIISNSWGSDDGDPDGPDSQLVKKLAEEGRIMVFAAGNAGSRKNTVGSPAIVVHRDPATGAPRVLAVAATDREGRVAYFSSRGKGSRMTSRDPKYKDWPQRPDLAEQGYNTEGAWPANLGPGRVDPELGPLNAISGTSMSTPKVAGTLALLAQLFGVTTVGEKLDAIVNAVMKTLVNPLNQGKDDVGEGFSAAYAAYQELAKTMSPVAPPFLAKWVLRLLVR